MRKKLTITVDEVVYRSLHRSIGAGRISRFIEDLLRPHVLGRGLEEAYREMSLDEEAEDEALEWSEGLVGDVADEAR